MSFAKKRLYAAAIVELALNKLYIAAISQKVTRIGVRPQKIENLQMQTWNVEFPMSETSCQLKVALFVIN